MCVGTIGRLLVFNRGRVTGVLCNLLADDTGNVHMRVGRLKKGRVKY